MAQPHFLGCAFLFLMDGDKSSGEGQWEATKTRRDAASALEWEGREDPVAFVVAWG
jgi:hypothetical protein